MEAFNRKAGKKVTAIVPAYNEQENIGHVLNILNHVQGVDNILVVDDGSEDRTVPIVKQMQEKDQRLSLLSLPYNQGKGKAMLTGAQTCISDLLLFLDADLKSVKPHHIEDLISPVQEERCAMSVGLFADGQWTTSLTHKLFPFLSGQRCLSWPLFQDIYKEKISGWSIETALNLHAKIKRYEVKYVMWPGVTHAIRTEKRAGLSGYLSHVNMWWQIFRYTYFFLLHHNKTAGVPQAPVTYHTQWK